MRRSHVLTGAAAVAAAAALSVGPATAVPAPARPVAAHLAGPLQFSVTKHAVYVSESFAGLLTRIGRQGHVTHLATGQEGISGAAVRHGRVAFATSAGGGPGSSATTRLKVRTRTGKIRVIANLSRFEKRHNPDSERSYGFRGLGPKCAAKVASSFPDDPGKGRPYKGQVDSHPYAVANAPGGGWYVAEAGGNDILRVSRSGHIRVVYVGTPQKHVITAEEAKGAGLPACTVGHAYGFEPVPTDVEVTRAGHLVVSQLPGGPEGPALGARGSVVRVNPWTGHGRRVAGGFAGATNVALGRHGDIYVSELFANRVSVIHPNGSVDKVVDKTTPAAVQWGRGRLFIAVDVFNSKQGGRIVSVRP